MINNNVVEQTYDWLKTAFGDFKELSKEELIKKAELVKSLLIEEVDEFIDAVKNDDRMEQLNACSDLLVVASNLPFYASFKEEELHDENNATYESNMTKFCYDLVEAELSVMKYLNGTHPNKEGEKIQAKLELTGNKHRPFKILSENGKILKSLYFKDVDYFR